MTLQKRMAQAFAALNDDGRRFWLGCMEEEVKALHSKCTKQSPRPILRLIHDGPPTPASPTKTGSPKRIKSKGT